MSRFRNMTLLLPLVALAASAVSLGAAPIRVGMFKGVGGSGSYWHTSIHPGAAAITAMLANPTQAGLENPIIPPRGFSITMYGVDTACSGNGCKPSTEQLTAFMNALDSLDVVVFPNNVAIGSAIGNPEQRQRLATYWNAKGVVSLHWSTDNRGDQWAEWDSLHGSRFNNKADVRMGTLRQDSTVSMDPDGRILNRGLPDTARFLEEWVSFTTSANAIRARSGLGVTLKLDEASLAGGLGGMMAMGDHPISWYRKLPDGGRFFYTGLGHRTQLFTGAATTDSAGDMTAPANSFFRRQLYNAILWAARADSNGVVSVRGDISKKVSNFSDAAHVSNHRGAFSVSVLQEGSHRVEILGVDGKREAFRRGEGRAEYHFDALRSGVYLVSVTAGGQRVMRLVTTP